MDLKKLQKEIYQNKVDNGFNTTDVNKEFCLLYGEVGEAYDAYRKGKDDLGEELADIAIYLLGLSEILGKDLEEEIKNKVQINKNRKYKDNSKKFYYLLIYVFLMLVPLFNKKYIPKIENSFFL